MTRGALVVHETRDLTVPGDRGGADIVRRDESARAPDERRQCEHVLLLTEEAEGTEGFQHKDHKDQRERVVAAPRPRLITPWAGNHPFSVIPVVSVLKHSAP